MFKILLIEPHAIGHRMQYPRRIITELLSRGHSVTLATFKKSFENPLIGGMRAEFSDGFEIVEIPEYTIWSIFYRSPKWLFQNIGYYFLFRRFYKTISNNRNFAHVYLATLENCYIPLALLSSPFGGTPFSCLSMDVALGFSEMGIRLFKDLVLSFTGLVWILGFTRHRRRYCRATLPKAAFNCTYTKKSSPEIS